MNLVYVSPWERWFAWYPIIDQDGIPRWLRWMERQFIGIPMLGSVGARYLHRLPEN